MKKIEWKITVLLHYVHSGNDLEVECKKMMYLFLSSCLSAPNLFDFAGFKFVG